MTDGSNLYEYVGSSPANWIDPTGQTRKNEIEIEPPADYTPPRPPQRSGLAPLRWLYEILNFVCSGTPTNADCHCKFRFYIYEASTSAFHGGGTLHRQYRLHMYWVISNACWSDSQCKKQCAAVLDRIQAVSNIVGGSSAAGLSAIIRHIDNDPGQMAYVPRGTPPGERVYRAGEDLQGTVRSMQLIRWDCMGY